LSKKAVVVGAYGFIGSACANALIADGYEVTGIGRSPSAARQGHPALNWILKDICHMESADWTASFQDVDLVVNASGALQDGVKDSLREIHVSAVGLMVAALEGTKTRYIQISAAGVSEDAPTDFFRTKAQGDKLVAESDLEWVILRPVLVLGAQAYGGTALLRACAAMPGTGLLVFPETPIQTIFVEDLSAAIVTVASGRLGFRFVADLTEDNSQPFEEVVKKLRCWLGYAPWKHQLRLPVRAVWCFGRVADMLGWLGWRSPLRTNALMSLQAGVIGTSAIWRDRGGMPFRSLGATLATLPATAQERVFARLFLLLPVAIGALSLFWILSGVIALVEFQAAEALISEGDPAPLWVTAAVLGGAMADIVLGALILWRPLTRFAAIGMVCVSLAYLAGGSILVPEIWLDPLGPFVKILPGLVLAGLVAMLIEER